MYRVFSYALSFISIIIFQTGCSLLKNTQSASHPLVHQVDRNHTFKRSKNTYQSVDRSQNIENPSYNQLNSSIETKPIVKVEEKSNKNLKKTFNEPNGQIKSLIEEAEKYLGTPYRIGGTTKAGMDCSGLVMTVYQTQGIQLPRISPDQYKFGKPISIEEIQPGDLLFFSTPSNPHKIGHSAMCVAIEEGKIKFIHAASTGVRYDYLVPGYYLTHFKGACRIIQPNLSTNK